MCKTNLETKTNMQSEKQIYVYYNKIETREKKGLDEGKGKKQKYFRLS